MENNQPPCPVRVRFTIASKKFSLAEANLQSFNEDGTTLIWCDIKPHPFTDLNLLTSVSSTNDCILKQCKSLSTRYLISSPLDVSQWRIYSKALPIGQEWISIGDSFSGSKISLLLAEEKPLPSAPVDWMLYDQLQVIPTAVSLDIDYTNKAFFGKHFDSDLDLFKYYYNHNRSMFPKMYTAEQYWQSMKLSALDDTFDPKNTKQYWKTQYSLLDNKTCRLLTITNKREKSDNDGTWYAVDDDQEKWIKKLHRDCNQTADQLEEILKDKLDPDAWTEKALILWISSLIRNSAESGFPSLQNITRKRIIKSNKWKYLCQFSRLHDQSKFSNKAWIDNDIMIRVPEYKNAVLNFDKELTSKAISLKRKWQQEHVQEEINMDVTLMAIDDFLKSIQIPTSDGEKDNSNMGVSIINKELYASWAKDFASEIPIELL